MSQTNNIDTLRSHLFETLTALRDPAKPMDIDRAKAVCEVAQTIINTAKVEVDHARVTGTNGSSGFLAAAAPAEPAQNALPPGTQRTIEAIPGGRRIKNVAR